jgi:monoamine oxidase
MLASYTWGSQARRLGGLPPKERHAVVQQAVSKIHPQINQDGVLRQMVSWSWDNHPWSLGAFSFMKPYQQMGLYKDAIAPEGRIYFAGEHTSTEYAWIQGALESSLRAVKEMMIAAQA